VNVGCRVDGEAGAGERRQGKGEKEEQKTGEGDGVDAARKCLRCVVHLFSTLDIVIEM